MYVHMEMDISAITAYKKVVSCSHVAVVLSDEAGKSIVMHWGSA